METLEPILHIEYKNWVKLQSHDPLKFLSYRQWLEKEVIKLRAQVEVLKPYASPCFGSAITPSVSPVEKTCPHYFESFDEDLSMMTGRCDCEGKILKEDECE